MSLIVSRMCPHQEQTRLFPDERAITSPAQLRPYCGAFYEEVARVAFGLHRHQIDSTADVCPDLSDGKRAFVEVKSLRRGNQGIVYQERLRKDRALVRETHGRLTYAFCIHTADLSGVRSLQALRLCLAHSLLAVVCVPLDTLETWCDALIPQALNYRRGRGGQAMMGYHLPWRFIRDSMSGQTHYIPGLQAFGIGMPGAAFIGRP